MNDWPRVHAGKRYGNWLERLVYWLDVQMDMLEHAAVERAHQLNNREKPT